MNTPCSCLHNPTSYRADLDLRTDRFWLNLYTVVVGLFLHCTPCRLLRYQQQRVYLVAWALVAFTRHAGVKLKFNAEDNNLWHQSMSQRNNCFHLNNHPIVVDSACVPSTAFHRWDCRFVVEFSRCSKWPTFQKTYEGRNNCYTFTGNGPF